MPNADSAHRRLVIRLIRVPLALAGEEDEREVAAPGRGSGGTRPGSRTASGSICSMSVSTAAPRSRGPPPPPSTNVCIVADPGRERRPLGVGDDPLDLAELGLAGHVAVGPQQHRDRAEPADRDDERERARPAAHQHADVLALANADRDQPADDVVDPLVDLPGAVAAILEQEEDVVGRPAPALLDEQARARSACSAGSARAGPGAGAGRSASLRQLAHAARASARAVPTRSGRCPAPTPPASSRP